MDSWSQSLVGYRGFLELTSGLQTRILWILQQANIYRIQESRLPQIGRLFS